MATRNFINIVLNKWVYTLFPSFTCYDIWNQQNTFKYCFLPIIKSAFKLPITSFKNGIVRLTQKYCSTAFTSDVLFDGATVFERFVCLLQVRGFLCQYPYTSLYHMHIANTHNENFLLYPLLLAILWSLIWLIQQHWPNQYPWSAILKLCHLWRQALFVLLLK